MAERVVRDLEADRRLRRDGYVLLPTFGFDGCEALPSVGLALRGSDGSGFICGRVIDDEGYRLASNDAVRRVLDVPATDVFVDHEPFHRTYPRANSRSVRRDRARCRSHGAVARTRGGHRLSAGVGAGPRRGVRRDGQPAGVLPADRCDDRGLTRRRSRVLRAGVGTGAGGAGPDAPVDEIPEVAALEITSAELAVQLHAVAWAQEARSSDL